MTSIDLIKIFGEIAGIGGLALAVFLMLYRDIIRKSIFSNLTQEDSFRLMRLIVWSVWSIVAVGLVVWVMTKDSFEFESKSIAGSWVFKAIGDVRDHVTNTTGPAQPPN